MAINIDKNASGDVTYQNPPVNRTLFPNIPEAGTIEDGSITPEKLNSSNSASDSDVLSYNATERKFEWRDINGQLDSINSDITDLKADLKGTRTQVDEIATITLSTKKINPNFKVGAYNETGFHYDTTAQFITSDVLPSGTYTIPNTSEGIQYKVFNYISDTEGTQLYNYTVTGRTFTVNNPIVIGLRYISPSGRFSNEDINYYNNEFLITIDNSSNVLFPTKTELTNAIANNLNEVKSLISPFTQQKIINFFDGNFPETGYFNADGTNASSSSFKRTGYINIDANNEYLYFLRTERGYQLTICFYDENGTGLGRTSVFTDSLNAPLTANINIPTTAKTLRMYTRTSDYTGDLMLSYTYQSEYINYGTLYWIKEKVITEDNLSDALTEKVNANAKLTGKKIAFLGDSIIGNFYDATGVCAVLAEKTGATVINCAFGGSRIAYRYGTNVQYQYWNALSGAGLADAIASGDWTSQDTAVTNMTGGLAYFAERLAQVKAVDWSTVDFIMWEYGTNDFMTEVKLDGSDLYAYNYAYRHTIETILTAYPNIRIITVTPTYRWYQAEGVFTDDSNTHLASDYAGVQTKLTDFVAMAQTVSREYQIPCIDDYYTMGANRYTRLAFFDASDGTHPNEQGRTRIAEHISAQLTSLV